jgi:hypothetical protein
MCIIVLRAIDGIAAILPGIAEPDHESAMDGAESMR